MTWNILLKPQIRHLMLLLFNQNLNITRKINLPNYSIEYTSTESHAGENLLNSFGFPLLEYDFTLLRY